MIQGSQQWLEWRRKFVGASDQTHLHMCAPWSMGWAKLWDIKMGISPEASINFQMQRGTDLEPEARLAYTIETGIEIEPILMESKIFPHMCASLDGWNGLHKKLVEIKVPSQEDHDIAMSGQVPAKYLPQLHHQMIVAEVFDCDYVSFRNGNIAIVRVLGKQQYFDAVTDAAQRFHIHMVENVRPKQDYPSPLFDQRIPEITNPEILKEAAINLEIRNKLEQVETHLKESDVRLLSMISDKKAKVGGLQIVTVERDGAIDWKKATANMDLDVEKFRKNGSVSRYIKKI